MGDFLDSLSAAEKSRRSRKPLPQPEDVDEPILSRLFSPVSALFEGIGYIDAATRAGIANLVGMPNDARTGQETFLGPAPSGRELLGLGEGERGTFESGDIPGFLVEAAASPLNLLGIGTLTKGGKAASALAKTSERLNALQKMGSLTAEEGAQLSKRMATLQAELGARTAPYGKTLAEQARLGDRSLLALDVPFTDINVPLHVAGGRISEAVLGGLGRGAGAIGSGIRTGLNKVGIDPGAYFRLEGRADPLRIKDPASRSIYNSLRDVSEEEARRGLREGIDQETLANKFIQSFKQADADAILDRIKAKAQPIIEDSLQNDRSLIRLRNAYKKYSDIGDSYKASRIQKRISIAERKVNFLAGLGSGDSRQQLLAMAVEQPKLLALFDNIGADIAEKYTNKIAALDKKAEELHAFITDTSPKPTEKLRSFVSRVGRQRDEAMDELNKIAAKRQDMVVEMGARVAEFSRKGEMRRVALAELPKDVVNEANRINIVLSGKLIQEQAAGAPVRELESMGYMRRVINRNAIPALDAMAKADPSSSFARLARLNSVKQGFMVERVPDFDWLSKSQINDWFKSEADRLGIKTTGPLFIEDAGESMIRRLMESGRSLQNISFHRGVIEQFMVPRSLAQASDTPIEEYLKSIGVTKFNDTDLRTVIQPEIEKYSTQSMFREVNPDNASLFINTNGRIPWGRPSHFVTDNPDLAIGQGGNKGVTIEFDSSKLPKLKEHIKPGTQIPGVGKEYTFTAHEDEVRDAVRSVTIKPEFLPKYDKAAPTLPVFDSGSHAIAVGIQNNLTSKGWTKEVLNDGSWKFTRPPEIAPAVKRGDVTPASIKEALKGTKYENAFVPQQFAKQALETTDVLRSPQAIKSITDIVGWYTSWMRAAVTIYFPAFHARNAVSNIFLMWLAGWRDPRLLVEAANLQRLAAGALDAGATVEMKQAKAFLARMQELGAYGATEAAETAEMRGLTAYEKTKTALKRSSEAARRIGGGIENNAKIALYLDGVRNGLSEAEAAERVKRYLFNYADLSRFEKDYLRRWAFFYTWQRKNLPLMLESLVDNTAKMRLAAVAGGQAGNLGEQQDLLSPYQAGQSSIPLRADEQGRRQFLQLGLPLDTLFQYEPDKKTGFNAIRTGVRKILSNLSPVPASAINLATGTSLRTGRPVGAVDSLLDATPLARVGTTLQILTNPPPEQTAADAIGRFIGFPTVRADPRTAPLRRLLEKIDDQKAKVDSTHLSAVLGGEEERKAKLKELNSLESRVRSRLSKLMGRR